MQTLSKIIERFAIEEPIVSIEPITNGFINSTYKVVCENRSYILQRINVNVFPNVDGLMNNIDLVTKHIYKKTQSGMYVVPTKDRALYVAHEDSYYRVYNFIEDSVAYNSVDNPEIFYQAGVGFGKFQNDLADFDATVLFDVIANFHTTTKRLENFRDAVAKDPVNRVATCAEEIKFYEDNAEIATWICDKLDSGELPYRVTHNDTKLNNILFDPTTNTPICAVDLDTVMKGSVLYDVGDAIRYGANPAGELGTDADRVYVDTELYKAFISGFLKETYTVLTPLEIEMMPASAVVMTYECGIRFLEDYIRGDVYFGEAFKNINLQRARSQMDLVKDLLAKMPELKQITKECYDALV
ncbi:MAG: phosphotransferase [Clostridia bacterium]|nr:phosphotransferase [Clostridia bacterium]